MRYDLLAKQQGSIRSRRVGQVNRQAAGTLAHNRAQCLGDLIGRAYHTILKRAYGGALAQALHLALVFGHQHARVYYLHDRVIVAPDCLAVPFEHRLLMRIFLGAAPNVVPPIAGMRLGRGSQ